jgi:hypothetical protein
MTLAQFRLYSRAAAKARRQAMREQALVARATQFDKQGFSRFLAALEKDDDHGR